MTTFLVNELYNKLTFQGEGQSLGQLCSFIRLFSCNLHCCFCDSYFTWRTSDKHPHKYATEIVDSNLESKRMSINEIVGHFKEMNPPMLVITGGEPMLQAKKLPELITQLINDIPALTRIEIETAGTIFSEKVSEYPFVYFNVSPKLESSGNPLELRYKVEVLKAFNQTGRATFKFVVCGKEDFEEIEVITEEVGIQDNKVYIMPEGIDGNGQKEKLQFFADKVLEKRWNLTTRLHVMIWGNERGT